MNTRRILLAVAATALCMTGIAQDLSINECNCFCVIAGRNTTVDGSVLMAHNEDDSGEMMLNMYASPRSEGQYGFLWAEFPGTQVVDHFLNEWGVAFASDGCMSREDRSDLTDGGWLYEVRLNGAKNARSAREAVKYIGRMVEKYGYRDSGRSYVISDTREGWVCSVVRGRHWVAQRVPDDMVMALPNNYIIDHVNLQDTANFYGSADLVGYARERGWYVPERDGEFSFKRAYGRPNTYVFTPNVVRQMCAQMMITGRTDMVPDPDTFPFAVKPNRKIGIPDLMEIMQCHAENTTHKYSDSRRPTKWTHPVCICTDVTILSAIFQLRDWMPREVGCVMWVCPGRPCTEAYVPWHLGITEVPARWHRCATAAEAEAKHFSDAKNLRERYPDHAYWKGVERWAGYALDWYGKTDSIKAVRDAYQQRVFKENEQHEQELKQYYNGTTVTNSDKMHQCINKFIDKVAQ